MIEMISDRDQTLKNSPLDGALRNSVRQISGCSRRLFGWWVQFLVFDIFNNYTFFGTGASFGYPSFKHAILRHTSVAQKLFWM
jgi:hypothetical protein